MAETLIKSQEIKILSNRKSDEELSRLAEKHRKKRSGLIGFIRGVEERIELSGRFIYPYWLLSYKYRHSVEKGFIKKQEVEVIDENFLIIDAHGGEPSTQYLADKGFKNKHSVLQRIESMVGQSKVAPSISYDSVKEKLLEKWDTIQRERKKLVAEIIGLKRESEPLRQELNEDEHLKQDTIRCIRYIEEQQEAISKIERTSIENAKNEEQRIKHSAAPQRVKRLHMENLHKGVDLSLVETKRDLAETSLRLQKNQRELSQIEKEIANLNYKLAPFDSKIHKKLNEISLLEGEIEKSFNMLKEWELIEFTDGVLFHYPFWAVKYIGMGRGDKESIRWIVFDGLTGKIDKVMEDKKSFLEDFYSQ